MDLTSAERKRRYRRRLYGTHYYGTEGDVQEIRRETADDIAMLEAEGRAFSDGSRQDASECRYEVGRPHPQL